MKLPAFAGLIFVTFYDFSTLIYECLVFIQHFNLPHLKKTAM